MLLLGVTFSEAYVWLPYCSSNHLNQTQFQECNFWHCAFATSTRKVHLDTRYHEIVSYILNFQYLIDIQIYLLRNVASCLFCTFCLFVCLFHFVMLQCPKPCHRTLGTIGKPSMRRPGWCTVEEGVLIMFRFLWCKELLNVEQFCHWKLNKIKPKSFKEIGGGKILVLLESLGWVGFLGVIL
jgi:hypothetical protein